MNNTSYTFAPTLCDTKSAPCVIAIVGIRWKSLRMEGWDYKFCGKEGDSDVIEAVDRDTKPDKQLAVEVDNTVSNEHLKIRLPEAVWVFGGEDVLGMASKSGPKRVYVWRAAGESKSMANCFQIQG